MMAVPVGLGLMGWAAALSGLFLKSLDPKLRGPFAFTAALCLFSCFAFGLAVNGLLFPVSTLCFFLPFVPAGVSALRLFIKEKKVPIVPTWVMGMSGLVLCIWIIEFASPPLIWDAVLDHFRLAGVVARLHFLPFHWTNHTGDIPKFAEIIWAGFWSMGGEFMAKASLGLSVLLTAWLLWAYALSKNSNPTLGPLLLLTGPCFLALYAWGYVEGHLALFELLSLVAFLEWVEKPEKEVWLPVSAFFLGAAFATKYTALLWLVGLMAVLIRVRRNPIRPNRIWLLLALLIFCPLPWYLRNGMANGNPFYPLASGLFGGPPDFDPGMEKALWLDTGRTFGSGLLGMLERLWNIFFTTDNGIGACWTPLVFMALPFLFNKNLEKRHLNLILFSLAYFGSWVLFCTNLRHGTGGGLALVLLASLLWGKALQDGGALRKILFGLGLILSTALTILAQMQTTCPYSSALGMEDSLVRLQRHYSFNLDTYAAYREIENHSDESDKVLAFGVFQTYPLGRQSFVDFFWKKPILLKWAEGRKTAAGLALALREQGVSEVLYQGDEAAMMSRKEKDFELTGMPEKEYAEFWKRYAQPYIALENSTVYRVLTEPAPRPFPLINLPGLQERDEKIISRLSSKSEKKYGMFYGSEKVGTGAVDELVREALKDYRRNR